MRTRPHDFGNPGDPLVRRFLVIAIYAIGLGRRPCQGRLQDVPSRLPHVVGARPDGPPHSPDQLASRSPRCRACSDERRDSPCGTAWTWRTLFPDGRNPRFRPAGRLMKGRVVGIFGLPLPSPFLVDTVAAKWLEGAHELTANGLVALAGLHAAAAVIHHLVLKDGTLRRMLPAGPLAA